MEEALRLQAETAGPEQPCIIYSTSSVGVQCADWE
jgi:hypothetical protein